MKTRICILSIFTLWLQYSCSTLIADDSSPASNISPRIGSEDELERLSIKKSIIRQRDEIVAELVQVIDNYPIEENSSWRSPSTPKNVAISVLGEMRAAEAAPSIAKWVIPPKGGVINSTGLWPALEALVKIGKPASRSLIECLAKIPHEEGIRSRSRFISERILTALTKIEGNIHAVVILLEEAVSEERDAVKRTNLERMLTRAKTISAHIRLRE